MKAKNEYLREARRIDLQNDGFWGDDLTRHRHVEQWLGYWGSGDGENNPADFTKDEKVLFYCFMAAISTSGWRLR